MREPYIRRNRVAVYLGDVREVLREMPAESVSMVCTSPPYLGLRSYGTEPQIWGGDPQCCHSWEIATKPGQSGGTASAKVQIKGEANFQIVPDSQHATCSKCQAWRGELGLEPTPELFVSHLVDVFREVRRVLHPSGVLLLNLGDSYAGGTQTGRNDNGRPEKGRGWAEYDITRTKLGRRDGLKPKDLMEMPSAVVAALRADGWYLRSRFPWVKANPMPESVQDRPSSSVEYIFLLSKSERYFWDGDAVRAAHKPESIERAMKPWRGEAMNTCHPNGRNRRNGDWWRVSLDIAIDAYRAQIAHMEHVRDNGGLLLGEDGLPLGLSISTEAFPEAHFATFPQALVEPLVRAGTSEHGVCSECGAPWRRVVEKGRQFTRPIPVEPKYEAGFNGEHRTKAGLVGRPIVVSAQTTGWEPTCRHGAEVVPAVVLDPFSGSGTTLLVAQRLGRIGWGIEIKAEYADISGRRLAQEVLPL